MALVRSDPLPPGYYWRHVAPDQHAAFVEWTKQHRPTVKVRTVQALTEGWEFVLFELVAPTPYPAKKLGGWPDQGRRGMTAADSSQSPIADIEEPLDIIDDTVAPLRNAMGWLPVVAIVGVGALLFSKLR